MAYSWRNLSKYVIRAKPLDFRAQTSISGRIFYFSGANLNFRACFLFSGRKPQFLVKNGARDPSVKCTMTQSERILPFIAKKMRPVPINNLPSADQK
ncbi:hypothetical protein ACQCT5_07455 [Sutcliffiella halmapala]